ncbi:MAG: HIT domain-containing protein [Deltaproteobacteria bacterium]|nr:HIT domain-containing protein [Deltaproteobacteria bacterium]
MSQRITREEALARVHHPDGGCWMCTLARASYAPEDVVVARDGASVRLDRLGCTHGHLLVVPEVHETRVEELPLARYLALQALAWEAARALGAVLSPRRIWVAALGAPDPLPMSFPHGHLHVVPIHEGGEAARPARVLTWSEGVVAYEDDEARALVLALREALRPR